MDGIEALKKYKKNPLVQAKTKGKPVFSSDGKLEDIKTPTQEEDREEPIQEEVNKGIEWPETPPPVQARCVVKFPGDTETSSPGPRICKYCDTRVYNNQVFCKDCKEKRFREIWVEQLQPLLEKQTFFVKKDVEEIDFPLTLNNSLAWYIENDYLTIRKNGNINEYYTPTPQEIGENTVPGITKKCRTCQEIKPVKEFYKQKRSGDGYGYICKECDKKSNTNKKQKKPEYNQPQHIQQVIIDDMQRQHRKGHPIKIHLYLLEGLEKYEEGG